MSYVAELPMFPLEVVLVPGMFLPLHVFEQRYREMIRTCMRGGREFGVVLIERGSEVGGGDVRSCIGTRARIVSAAELADGRWALGILGSRRIRVRSWLPDAPYPRAEVEDWPDAEPARDVSSALGEAVALLRRVLAMKAELGEPAAQATIELSSDPVLGSYQASAAAPIGAADRQRLLCADGPSERVELLALLLAEEQEFLRSRLALG